MKDLSCVSSQKLFSLAQSRGSACNLLIRDSESAGLLSLVAGHQAAKMCLQLSLPLDQAPRSRNSPSPDPDCFCCLLRRPSHPLTSQGASFQLLEPTQDHFSVL